MFLLLWKSLWVQLAPYFAGVKMYVAEYRSSKVVKKTPSAEVAKKKGAIKMLLPWQPPKGTDLQFWVQQ